MASLQSLALNRISLTEAFQLIYDQTLPPDQDQILRERFTFQGAYNEGLLDGEEASMVVELIVSNRPEESLVPYLKKIDGYPNFPSDQLNNIQQEALKMVTDEIQTILNFHGEVFDLGSMKFIWGQVIIDDQDYWKLVIIMNECEYDGRYEYCTNKGEVKYFQVLDEMLTEINNWKDDSFQLVSESLIQSPKIVSDQSKVILQMIRSGLKIETQNFFDSLFDKSVYIDQGTTQYCEPILNEYSCRLSRIDDQLCVIMTQRNNSSVYYYLEVFNYDDALDVLSFTGVDFNDFTITQDQV